MPPDEELRLANERLRDIVGHIRLLGADADAQNNWNPCGWTRLEPYEHVSDHKPCAPIAELVDSFDDMWPRWRSIVAPALSAADEAALDRLAARLQRLDPDAYRDEIETLDGEQSAEVRQLANQVLGQLTPP